MLPFSGYQDNIYDVDDPHQLPGSHARLIEGALRPGERILHLLICPLWDSTTEPFGIQAPRASHALCLTPTRLLVSRDYHRRRVEPTVFAIGRESLGGLEFGEALMMSWLALYVRRGATLSREGFYFPHQGNHCVASLLRSWRQGWPLYRGRGAAGAALTHHEVLRAAGHFHAGLLRPLLGLDEACWRVSRRPPIWGTQRRWLRCRPVGLAHWGTLLLTDRAFYYVWSRPPLGKTGYVVEHNLLCFSLRELYRAECEAHRAASVECVRLLLTFGAEGDRRLEILFPQEQAASAHQWARDLTGLAETCTAIRSPDVP